MMYTKKSNVAEWWQERNKLLITSLPYVVALFNAQLLAISGSAVTHAVLNFGKSDLAAAAAGVQKNLGNAKRVASSTELFKFSHGQDTDSREYGIHAKEETLQGYAAIQALSKTRHKDINMAVMSLMAEAGSGFAAVAYEQSAGKSGGLSVDVLAKVAAGELHLEFHHKAEGETDSNSVSIYTLTKLKEYAINYGLTPP